MLRLLCVRVVVADRLDVNSDMQNEDTQSQSFRTLGRRDGPQHTRILSPLHSGETSMPTKVPRASPGSSSRWMLDWDGTLGL